MNEFFTPANVVLIIGVSILFLVNFYLFISLNSGGWGGIGGLVVYLIALLGAGFPLVTISSILLFYNGFMPIEDNDKKRGRLVLMLNILFIVQWIIWWLILKNSF